MLTTYIGLQKVINLFADDTNLLYTDKNIYTVEDTVNVELMKVYERLTSNKLTLNVKNSDFTIFKF